MTGQVLTGWRIAGDGAARDGIERQTWAWHCLLDLNIKLIDHMHDLVTDRGLQLRKHSGCRRAEHHERIALARGLQLYAFA